MKAIYDDWRGKSSFSQWERACLLADVEPGSEMTDDEMQDMRQWKDWIKASDALIAGPEPALMKKLLAGRYAGPLA